MSDHEHEWIVQNYVFPSEAGVYEYDEPYAVFYCADRECVDGRTTRLLTPAEIAEVRGAYQLGPYEAPTAPEGGEQT